MAELITLKQWAEKREISKQWACHLCAEGRVPGAVFVDNYQWMVPEDAPSPARKLSARIREAQARRAARLEKSDDYHADRMMKKFGVVDDDYL